MQLLQHFNELSLHPKNVRNLKTLILQLAVQGKLTEKWRRDNPLVEHATILLKRIYAEKDTLIKNKIFKAKYDTDFFEPLIKRPPIPSTWIYVTVGNICELLTGATPSKAKSSYFGGDIKWLVSGDIHLGYINDCEGRITELGMSSSNCKILPMNSVMMALNGQGKTRATVALLKTQATCNQSLLAMKPFLDDENLSEYIYYLLKGKYYEIRDITGQHQRRGLNMTLVSQLPLALPPLEEQKAIVEVVNQLFAEVDQLETLTKERIHLKEDFVTSALKQLSTGDTSTEWVFLKEHFSTFFTEKTNIKKLRESILQLAVQGKLTSDWRRLNPDVENAKVLLERIQNEKEQLVKEKKVKKETPLPKISDEEIPYELPEGWEFVRLGSIIKISSGDGLTSANMDENGGIPVYGGNGITGYHSNNNVSKPEIVIGRVGYYCGSIHLSEEKAWVTDNAFVTKFSETNIYRDFLMWLLKGTNLKEDENATAQPVISGRKVYPIIVGLPPLEEQKNIVEKVNSLMVLCDELEAEIEISKTTQEKWMESSLREVFEWEIKN